MLIPIVRCNHKKSGAADVSLDGILEYETTLHQEDIFINPDYVVYVSHSHPDLEKLKAKSVVYMSKESPVTMVFTKYKFDMESNRAKG